MLNLHFFTSRCQCKDACPYLAGKRGCWHISYFNMLAANVTYFDHALEDYPQKEDQLMP